MLKRFEVSNYKTFKDPLIIDFSSVGGYQFNPDCISNNVISKMLIYGRNATGKSNLGRAITDIALPRFVYQQHREYRNFLNADSDCDSAKFDYLFQFNDAEVRYIYYKFAAADYKSEMLSINGTVIFDFDYVNSSFFYDNLSIIAAETIIVDRFIEVLSGENSDDNAESAHPSFLQWLFANAVFGKGSPMAQMRAYISRMGGSSISVLSRSQLPLNSSFLQSLEKDDELQRLEAFLNAMGVDCKLATKLLPDGQVELYFKHKKLIPFFETASSGTYVLFNIYRRIIANYKSLSFIYLDEFDAYFHYEMSEKFLKYLKENFPNCQILLTTHNTNLMTNRLMRPDCVFVLTQAGKITPLNKATTRELREGHNLEKLYMSGEFNG